MENFIKTILLEINEEVLDAEKEIIQLIMGGNLSLATSVIKKRLLSEFKVQPELRMVVRYSGYGDSGEEAEIEDVTSNIQDLVDSLYNSEADCWDAVQVVQYDYYNNEGGYGDITIDIFNKTFSVEGYVRTTSSELMQGPEDIYLFEEEKNHS